jgi:hypothetical protein
MHGCLIVVHDTTGTARNREHKAGRETGNCDAEEDGRR